MSKQRHYRTTVLWRLLEEQGRTYSWLSRQTGFSRSYIYLMREGNKPITEAFATRAAAAMNMPLANLFDPADDGEGT